MINVTYSTANNEDLQIVFTISKIAKSMCQQIKDFSNYAIYKTYADDDSEWMKSETCENAGVATHLA